MRFFLVKSSPPFSGFRKGPPDRIAGSTETVPSANKKERSFGKKTERARLNVLVFFDR